MSSNISKIVPEMKILQKTPKYRELFKKLNPLLNEFKEIKLPSTVDHEWFNDSIKRYIEWSESLKIDTQESSSKFSIKEIQLFKTYDTLPAPIQIDFFGTPIGNFVLQMVIELHYEYELANLSKKIYNCNRMLEELKRMVVVQFETLLYMKMNSFDVEDFKYTCLTQRDSILTKLFQLNPPKSILLDSIKIANSPLP